jgi:hypothetical protein
MIGTRFLCLAGVLTAAPSMGADISVDGMVDRIAAHFEAASSRLRPEDANSLDQFVSRVRRTPGASLAVLVPITTEPARSRFVAARVIELERHVQELAETAEYRHIPVNSNADILWLALVLPASTVEEPARALVPPSTKPVDPASAAPLALTAPAVPSAPSAPPVNPAAIRLSDWVVRGVKRPAQGPVSAYVARTAPGAQPREVFERQSDRELGLVKEISLSAEGGWVVHTEIGWIGQNGPAGGP